MRDERDVSWTFEELASRELDRLWQGALFLSAGDEAAAELLLEAALSQVIASGSFRSRQPPVEAGHWLEGELARAFLDTTVAPQDGEGGSAPRRKRATSPTPRTPGMPAGPEAALVAAAGRLPARARAALWLVALRRWTYQEAARVLGLDGATLRACLDYRSVLVAAVLQAGRGVSSQQA
jgi:DNA-directed RNA polymerase specialized sigma24 family protein